jgi:hypothetical protein
MALDNYGNIYVTGFYWDTLVNFNDYLTVKYSPSGDTLWTRRYHGPANEIDQAYDIAVDASGNAYVTGISESEFDELKYATIKYGPDGDTLWIARYAGTDSEYSDYAYAIAVDDSGNAYVTGESRSESGFKDYATIKYDASGDTAWVRRYDNGMTDIARDIAVDHDGNVYVTGYSLDPANSDGYLTIKYSPDGDSLWISRYDGPGSHDRAHSLAIDDSGNVYVTGRSEDSLGVDDCVTIKYGPSGDSLWIARYDRDSYDTGNTIAVDDSGNVYVTGHAGSGYASDYLTIKYDAYGDTVWVARYDGPSSESDTACAIALDDSGNVYVTGVSHAYDTEWDYLTIKYSPSGDTLWTARYDGPVDGNDYPYAVAVDYSGYVCVTGSSVGSGTSNDFLTIKYSSSTGIQEQPAPQTHTTETLTIFPNPFDTMIRVSYSAPATGEVSIRVFDGAGRLRKTIYEGRLSQGHHDFVMDGHSLNQGVYFIRVVTKQSTLTEKIALVK